ncbi:PaaI family thioesterase [Arenimonas sp. MALMAid1274]|uniref:PaaI family thioesterase n=1 Tax=Arenimonas sp. MALMAid1274 TaxID=3411630 RepID=UPI003BA35FE8
MPVSAAVLDDLLRARLPPGLKIPPPCLLGMQGQPLEYEDGQWLSMRFPVLEAYQNPLGYMQGGFIAAALDNTLGPFSYLIAPPSVTSHLSLDYLRPVPPGMAYIDCIARLVSRTRHNLYLSGEVVGPEGKVLVLAHCTSHLLGP